MDKTKHTKIVYCTDLKSAKKQAAKPYFKDATEYQHEYFEVEMRKRETKQNMPVQIGAAIFQYAKLRMLQFYYDFLMEYIDASDFQMMYMDTDSCYIAITSDCIENLIKPEKKDLYEKEKVKWFPRTDTKENEKYDERTPGLFKTEFEGDGMVCLSSKLYYCLGKKDKFSCKGVQKINNKDII